MKKLLTASVAIVMLASAGAASAQSYGQRDRDNDRRYEQRHDRQDRREDRREDRQERREDRREARQERREDRQWARYAQRRYNAGRYVAPRGYQQRQWRRGDYMPQHYRGAAYRVDHRRYGLAPAPYGYQYTRVGNDVVLTAIATGVIASVIFGLFQ